jgi:hypothetical protein
MGAEVAQAATMVESRPSRKPGHVSWAEVSPARTDAPCRCCIRYRLAMHVASALAVVVALLAAGPAEPPSLLKAVKAADKAAVDKALAAAGLSACSTTVRSGDIDSLACRLVVVAALNKPIASVNDVKARREQIADAFAAADYASSLTSTDASSKGLRRSRFAAHEAACSLAFDGINALQAVPARHAARADSTAALSADNLHERACACAQRTMTLAVGADASPDEQARAQGVLTTHQCFTGGELAVSERKGPGTSFAAGSDATKDMADAGSPAGRLVALANSRAVEMTRCTDKGMKDGKVTDARKLETCACNVVKRWSLPFKKDDPSVSAVLPIVPGVELPIVVDKGAIGTCGPLRGSLVVGP